MKNTLSNVNRLQQSRASSVPRDLTWRPLLRKMLESSMIALSLSLSLWLPQDWLFDSPLRQTQTPLAVGKGTQAGRHSSAHPLEWQWLATACHERAEKTWRAKGVTVPSETSLGQSAAVSSPRRVRPDKVRADGSHVFLCVRAQPERVLPVLFKER